MTSLSNLKVYTTPPHDCSYLPNQKATTIFIDPETSLDTDTYTQLANVGFRRSGPHVYRPHCQDCNACTAARIPVADFKASRRQRKIINRNQQMEVIELNTIDTDECYLLYQRYITLRHSDGDMYPPEREQYRSFLSNEMGLTKYYGFIQDQQLQAVAVTDLMNDGLSAMYTFFNPDLDRQSLGGFAILWQIKQAKVLQLPYVYLGYWIKDCQKMSYKTDYRPLQLFINNRWLNLN